MVIKMLIQELNYANKKINYYLNLTKRKGVSIKYQNAKIIVSAPFFVNIKVIEDFLISKWHILEKWMKNPKIKLINFLEPAFIFLLGIKYSLNFNLNQKRNSLSFKDNKFILNVTNFNEEIALKTINNFFKKYATKILNNRLAIYSKILNLSYKISQIRLLKTKWGMCYYQKQKIILNYKIIHFSQEIIDYVIIHELVHLKHPNHSKSFWAMVEIYCANYKEYQKYLKQIFL